MNGTSHTRRSSRAVLLRQRRQLSEWLDEWRLEQVLLNADRQGPAAGSFPGGNDPASGETSAGSAAALPGRVSAPADGQIRLLAPDTAGTRRRPLYALILADWQVDGLLAIPFGVLSKPALPGEWRTGLRALPVRVLCLWNTRRIHRDRVQRSWCVRDLDSRRLSLVRRLAADCFSWPASLRNRLLSLAERYEGPLSRFALGPPLLHPLDPRHQYLTEETGRLDDLGPPPAAVNGDCCWLGNQLPGSLPSALRYEPSREQPLLKAAEPHRTTYEPGNSHGGRPKDG